MSRAKLSYNELEERLARAEAALEALRQGEVDSVVGAAEPLVVRLRSLIEENERLSREWQTTFEGMKDAVFVIDPECRVRRSNLAAQQIFQRPPSEIIGEHCWEIVHGTQEPIPECPLLRMRRSLRREQTELRFGDRWFEVTVDPILDADNCLAGAVHIISDITERRQMEESLRESEARHRLITELISDYAYIFRVTEGGELRGEWVTESFTSVFGLTLEEVDDRGGWQSLVYSEDLGTALEHAQKVVGGLADICEMRWVAGSGEVRWLRDYARPVFDSLGKRVVRIYGAAQDITDRKRAEQELRTSEEGFRRFLDESPLGVTVVAEDGETLYINKAALDIFGCQSKEEWQKVPVEKRYTRSSSAEHKKRRKKRLLGETTLPQYEVDVLRADGEVRHLQVWRHPTLWHGRQYYQVTYRDVTEVKNAHERLLEALDSLRQSFSAIIEVIVTAVESRDPYTAGHQLRVAELAAGIAEEMGLPPAKVDGIRVAGSIHDIGKLSIPAEILAKPTRISAIEHSLIKQHAGVGFEMLKSVRFPWPLAEIVHQHHERMDGSGYPKGLKGDQILLEARVLAVADVVESMASHRPYRPAVGFDAALEEISRNRGILYDPEVVDACLRLFLDKGFCFSVGIAR